jgi:SecD/SecF fusion protein
MNNWIKASGIGLIAAVTAYFITEQVSATKKKPLYNATYTIQAAFSGKGMDMQSLTTALSNRLKAGAFDFQLKSGGANSLTVSLKKITDTGRIEKLLVSNGRIQFREVYTLSNLGTVISRLLEIQKAQKKSIAASKKKTGTAKDTTLSSEVSALLDSIENYETTVSVETQEEYQLLRLNNSTRSNDPVLGIVKAKDTAEVMKLLQSQELTLLAPADAFYFFGKSSTNNNRPESSPLYSLYALKMADQTERAVLENADIQHASMDLDQLGRPMINIQFDNAGRLKWASFTRQNTGKPIAILFNREVVTAPVVESAITEGSALISGNFTVEECENIASLLVSQPLPAQLSITAATIHPVKAGLPWHSVLLSVLVFALFSGLGLFLFKTLKST